MTQAPSSATDNSNAQMLERREKLNTLRSFGQAYPNDFHRDAISHFLRHRGRLR